MDCACSQVSELMKKLKEYLIGNLKTVLETTCDLEEISRIHEKSQKVFLIADMVNLLEQREKQIPEKLIKELTDKLSDKKEEDKK